MLASSPVAGDRRFDISTAIRSGAKLLYDPRREPGRRVGQRESEGLRPGALDPLVAGLLPKPRRKFAVIAFLLGRRRRGSLALAAHRQQVDVKSEKLVGMGITHARGGDCAPVAALDGEFRVAEPVVHQRRQAVSDFLNAEARLARSERQAVAGQ